MKMIFVFLTFFLFTSSFCQNNQWINFNTSNSRLPNNSIYSIAIDHQGMKWIATDGNGVVKFDGTKWATYNSANSGFPCNNIRAIAVDAENNKWIGTRCGGLYKFDGNKWTVYDTTNSILPDLWVACIAIDRKGVKWIGCGEGGLVKIDGDNWTLYNKSNSPLPVDNVYSLAADTLGNIWIGTNGGGLVKYDGVNWINYNKKNSALRCNASLAIALDKDNNPWIGSYTCGIFKFNGKTFINYDTTNSPLRDSWVVALAIDRKDIKWIGLDSAGMASFSGTEWKEYAVENSSLASNYIRSITIDEQGNKWGGTYYGGISVFNENGVDFKTLIIVSSPGNNSDWVIGSKQTVTWSGSNVKGSVNIKLSIDGGFTYPVTLATNTGNDGTEIVNVPPTPSALCKVKVESVLDPNQQAANFGYFRIVKLEAPRLILPANNSNNLPEKLTLNWAKSKYADKYRLNISENNEFSKLFLSDSTIVDSTKDIAGLKHGKKYFWQVTASNNSGAWTSSAIWNFITRLHNPDSLKASVLSKNKIQLYWRDNSNNETGFIVERSFGNGFTAIDTIAPNNTSFVDSSVSTLGNYQYRIKTFTADALSEYSNIASATVTSVKAANLLPDKFTLYGNYPNPFNPNTTISYYLPALSSVELIIYDIKGTVVRSISIDSQNAGYNSIIWDGKDTNNKQMASGTYVFRLRVYGTDGGIYEKTSKMLMMK